MRLQDVKTCMSTLAMDRCRNNLTDLRVIMDIMRQQTSFNYKMAVHNAELLYRQGKYDELGLILMLISREIPGYDENLVRNAQFLINAIADDLKLNISCDTPMERSCPENDNQDMAAS